MRAEKGDAADGDRYLEGVIDGVIGVFAFGFIFGGVGLAYMMMELTYLGKMEGMRPLSGFVVGAILAFLGLAWFAPKWQRQDAVRAAEAAAQIAEINRRDEAGEPQQWDIDRLEFLRAHFPEEAAKKEAELREKQRIANLRRR